MIPPRSPNLSISKISVQIGVAEESLDNSDQQALLLIELLIQNCDAKMDFSRLLYYLILWHFFSKTNIVTIVVSKN